MEMTVTTNAIEITLDNFQQIIIEESKTKPVLVDFWAEQVPESLDLKAKLAFGLQVCAVQGSFPVRRGWLPIQVAACAASARTQSAAKVASAMVLALSRNRHTTSMTLRSIFNDADVQTGCTGSSKGKRYSIASSVGF